MSQPNGDAIPLFRKILKLLELQRRGLADAQAPSRLLKNSFAFGNETGVIAVVDKDVPDEPPGGA